jgi:hypothetical protein
MVMTQHANMHSKHINPHDKCPNNRSIKTMEITTETGFGFSSHEKPQTMSVIYSSSTINNFGVRAGHIINYNAMFGSVLHNTSL